jgi:pimeloyl-ACP methyl ester carboxylesterase/putative sterol carrier protein
VPENDLLPLLEQRLRGLYSPLLADSAATMLFTAGGLANWTVEIDHGRALAHRGGPANPDATVRSTLAGLTTVVDGTRSGIEAFLAGELTVRGNLALCLQLDGLFPGDAGDPTRVATRGVTANGIETFYLEAGPPDAPTVVLVHGLAATNASMLPLFADLCHDFRVLAPDLPGHGGTQARSEAHTAQFLGDWLRDFLARTGSGPAVLVGNSLGGRTALQAALDHPSDQPDLVRGLVLLCPAVAFRKLRQFVPLVRIMRDELAILPVKVPRTMAMGGLRTLFADPSRLPEAWHEAAVDEFVRTLGIRANRQAVFSALRNIYLDRPFGAGGFWDRLPDLAAPALFLWGDKDPLVPAGLAHFVEQALPEARSTVLESCGHIPQFEHPALTAELTRNFIAGLDGTADGRIRRDA